MWTKAGILNRSDVNDEYIQTDRRRDILIANTLLHYAARSEMLLDNFSCNQSRRKDPRTPGREGGLTYAQGPHVRQGKNFLGACRCMTVVVTTTKEKKSLENWARRWRRLKKVARKLRANCCSSGVSCSLPPALAVFGVLFVLMRLPLSLAQHDFMLTKFSAICWYRSLSWIHRVHCAAADSTRGFYHCHHLLVQVSQLNEFVCFE